MGFDALARVYGGIEALCAGRLMQRVRTAHLAACPDQGRVLLAGEGHGRTLAALRKLKPGLELTYLDASPAMQRAARRHLARQGLEETGIAFHTGDALTFLPEEARYDVIITPFFLDCFTEAELKVLIPRLAALAKPGAQWLIADFQLPAAGWKRRRARLIHAMLHAFFRKAGGISARSWTDPSPILNGLGWHLEARREFSLELLRSDRWVC